MDNETMNKTGKSFTVDPEQTERSLAWQREHRKKCRGNSTIGGQFSYVFTETGIGTCVWIKCVCGAGTDMTDYSEW